MQSLFKEDARKKKRVTYEYTATDINNKSISNCGKSTYSYSKYKNDYSYTNNFCPEF